MNRKRVQKLRDMISGIPEEQFDLDLVFQNGHAGGGEPKPCGAIACIAGWAWIYPPFVKAGIRLKSYSDAMYGAAKFFGFSEEEVSPKQRGERGTDKQIALRRLDKLLDTGTDSTTT